MKDVWAGDLALIELLKGNTEAPAEVLQALAARGYLELMAGVPKLTTAGRSRANALRPHEHDLRLCFAAPAGGGAPLKTVGGSALHVNGGKPVEIRG